MKKLVIFLLGIFLINLALAFPTSHNLNIQVTNQYDNPNPGTYLFEFNITANSDCTNVLFSNLTQLTTDNRGIINYTLKNVNVNYNDTTYYLCYYRNESLMSTKELASVPYSYYSNRSNFWDALDTPADILTSELTNDLNWINNTQLPRAMLKSLVSWYRFEDNASNTNVIDSMDYSNATSNGVNTNWYSTLGKLNNGFYLDGDGTWITTNDKYTQIFDTGGITFNMWVKLDSDAGGDLDFFNARTSDAPPAPQYDFSVFAHENGGNYVLELLFSNTGNWSVNIASDGELRNGISKWHMVTATVEQDGSLIVSKLYLDGLFLDQATDTGNLSDFEPQEDIVIGGNYGGTFMMVGYMDEVMIFNKSLSHYEVSQLYGIQGADFIQEDHIAEEFYIEDDILNINMSKVNANSSLSLNSSEGYIRDYNYTWFDLVGGIITIDIPQLTSFINTFGFYKAGDNATFNDLTTTGCSCENGSVMAFTNDKNEKCWYVMNGSDGTYDMRGRMIIAVDSSKSKLDTIGEQDGTSSHFHTFSGSGGGSLGSGTDIQAGSDISRVFGFSFGGSTAPQYVYYESGGAPVLNGTIYPPYTALVYKECKR